MLEARLPERLGDLLRVPEHRQLHPARRIGWLAPRRAAPVGVAGVEIERRSVRVLQDARIEAHQADGDLERRRGRDAGRAVALLHEHLAGGGIGDDGADRAGMGSRGGQKAGGEGEQRAAPVLQVTLLRMGRHTVYRRIAGCRPVTIDGRQALHDTG
ncbi:hypothetical protein BC2230_10100 [Burkholderia cepacia]